MMADSNFSAATGAANPMIVVVDWQAGAPQTAGWYCASTERCADARRYWNGAQWSAPAYSDSPAANFDRARNTLADTDGDLIEWSAVIEACVPSEYDPRTDPH